MRISLWALGSGALFAVIGACSSAETSTDAEPTLPTPAAHDDGEAPDAARTSDASAEPVPRSPACLTLDTKLQAALDKTRKESSCREYALAVETASCALKSYVSSDTPNAPTNHTYRIASNTKMFVASVVLKLVAAGKMGLDDLVTKYLPDVPGLTAMTVRQILTHSAGLYDYSNDDAFDAARQANPKRKWKPLELLPYASKHEPYFTPPGSAYRYSNTNYIVAGMIAEKVGGRRIGELIRELLLVPAGLTDITFDGEEAPIGTLARGDDSSGNDVSTKYDESWIWAAGAMIATTSDLARWTQRLGSGMVHTPLMQTALEKGVSTGNAGATYGLGVFMYGPNYGGAAGRMIGHAGILIGYYSRSFHFPSTKTTVTAIVTCPDGSSEDVRVAALAEIFPASK